MIWGMRLSPGQESTHQVRSELNLTMASLDCRPEWTSGDSPTSAYLLMKTQNYENVICTLEKGQTNQQQLDLVLQPGEQVTFKVEGNGLVYLTGYSLKSPSSRDHSVGEAADQVQQSTQSPSLNPPPQMNQNTGNVATNQPMLLLLPRYSLINSSSLRGQVVGGTTGVCQPTQLPLLNLPVQVGGKDQNPANVRTNHPDTPMPRQQQISQNTTSNMLQGSRKGDDMSRRQDVMTIEKHTSTDNPSGSSEEHDKIPEGHSNMSDGYDKIMQGSEEGVSLQTQETQKEMGEGITHSSKVDVLGEPGAFEEVPHECNDGDSDGGTGELDDGANNVGDEDVEAAIDAADSDGQPYDGNVQPNGCDDEPNDGDGDGERDNGDDEPNDGDCQLNDGDGESNDGDSGDTDLEAPTATNESTIVTPGDTVHVESLLVSNCEEGELASHQDVLMESGLEELVPISGGERDGNGDGHSPDGGTSLVSSDDGTQVSVRKPLKNNRPETDRPEGHPVQSHDEGQVTVSEDYVTTPPETAINTGWRISDQVCRDLTESAANLQTAGISMDDRQRLYKCQYCEHISGSQDEIKSHMKSHSGIESVQEFKNRGDVSTADALQSDEENTAKSNKNRDEVTNRPFKCNYCEKSFKRKNDLGVHTRVHTVEPIWKCHHCDKSYRSKGKLARHEKSHVTLQASLDCDICGKTLSSLGNLQRHKRLSHTSRDNSSRSFKCQFCDKRFKSKQSRKEHEDIHTNKHLHQCSYCHKTVRGRSNWRKHELDHRRKKKLYECKICDKSFTLRTFKKHEIKHKEEPAVLKDFGEENWPFKCKFCEERFKSTRERVDHQKLHSGTALKCQFCGKIYALEENFKRHIDQHLGKAAPFQCGHCGKTFTCPRNGRRHERRHTTEKPLKCQFCDKRFNDKSRLLSHEGRVHTHVKPFKCQYCTKSYYARENLTVHIRVHTGEKPYPCRYCGELFVFHSGRKVHEKKHQEQAKIS
ncbi:hypothetical protein HOLleu_00238 [Holothuria leucospilota]|uniref:C2H2-type domain-containing protein n=1 Tax=Holothuria leucospilota TaxID=206669 RepID=A0A9Q1CNB3_HOLLE|nr:hypothetical protein HOLleu_00238 [Holothuria leucospilota]